MIKREQMCNHIIRIIHAPVRVYGAGGDKAEVYVDNGEMQDVLEADPAFLRKLLNERQDDRPSLFLEAEQVIYGIIAAGDETFILGPCCLGRSDKDVVGYLTREHGLDPKEPFRIFCPGLDLFCEAVIMLFETLTGNTISQDELTRKCFVDDAMLNSMSEGVHGILRSMRENSAVHNPYSQEEREQGAIRRGDLDALFASFREPYVGQLGMLAKDPVRNMKNLAIVLISLACRSAIQGGLLPEVAFSMSDAFIQQVETMRNVADISTFARQSEISYCKAVRSNNLGGRRSTLVMACKELVIQRIFSKITVLGLAEELDVTPEYLSRLFQKEEGIKLSEYISQEKVRYAKGELAYTDKSLDEIAYTLGFASQSHFGQTFKRHEGMTPGKYRELFRKIR